MIQLILILIARVGYVMVRLVLEGGGVFSTVLREVWYKAKARGIGGERGELWGE